MKEEKLPSLKSRGMALVKPRMTIVVLDAIGNGRLHAIEEEQAAEEDKRDGEGGSEKKQAGSVAVARDCPSEAVNDAGHGIEAIKPAPTLGHKTESRKSKSMGRAQRNRRQDKGAHQKEAWRGGRRTE